MRLTDHASNDCPTLPGSHPIARQSKGNWVSCGTYRVWSSVSKDPRWGLGKLDPFEWLQQPETFSRRLHVVAWGGVRRESRQACGLSVLPAGFPHGFLWYQCTARLMRYTPSAVFGRKTSKLYYLASQYALSHYVLYCLTIRRVAAALSGLWLVHLVVVGDAVNQHGTVTAIMNRLICTDGMVRRHSLALQLLFGSDLCTVWPIVRRGEAGHNSAWTLIWSASSRTKSERSQSCFGRRRTSTSKWKDGHSEILGFVKRNDQEQRSH